MDLKPGVVMFQRQGVQQDQQRQEQNDSSGSSDEGRETFTFPLLPQQRDLSDIGDETSSSGVADSGAESSWSRSITRAGKKFIRDLDPDLKSGSTFERKVAPPETFRNSKNLAIRRVIQTRSKQPLGMHKSLLPTLYCSDSESQGSRHLKDVLQDISDSEREAVSAVLNDDWTAGPQGPQQPPPIQDHSDNEGLSTLCGKPQNVQKLNSPMPDQIRELIDIVRCKAECGDTASIMEPPSMIDPPDSSNLSDQSSPPLSELHTTTQVPRGQSSSPAKEPEQPCCNEEDELTNTAPSINSYTGLVDKQIQPDPVASTTDTLPLNKSVSLEIMIQAGSVENSVTVKWRFKPSGDENKVVSIILFTTTQDDAVRCVKSHTGTMRSLKIRKLVANTTIYRLLIFNEESHCGKEVEFRWGGTLVKNLRVSDISAEHLKSCTDQLCENKQRSQDLSGSVPAPSAEALAEVPAELAQATTHSDLGDGGISMAAPAPALGEKTTAPAAVGEKTTEPPALGEKTTSEMESSHTTSGQGQSAGVDNRSETAMRAPSTSSRLLSEELLYVAVTNNSPTSRTGRRVKLLPLRGSESESDLRKKACAYLHDCGFREDLLTDGLLAVMKNVCRHGTRGKVKLVDTLALLP